MRPLIEQRRAGILTYGITPPKLGYSAEKRAEVAARQRDRIGALPVDALVVYDIQDESVRTPDERPFPFLPTVDPVTYAYEDLGDLHLPKVVYRSVAPHDPKTLAESLRRIEAEHGLCVLVGSPSSRQPSALSLTEAYALHQREFPALPLGGVLIAERHQDRHDEDRRVLRKLDRGCSFFITQAVYSAVASKNVLSDLYYRSQELERPLPPILITLSPCGSEKTLDFMRWLGIAIPRWLENELRHARDILQTSVDLCCEILADLSAFAKAKQIPLGCNIESVSLRKAEIEASVELVHRARALLGDALTATPGP